MRARLSQIAMHACPQDNKETLTAQDTLFSWLITRWILSSGLHNDSQSTRDSDSPLKNWHPKRQSEDSKHTNRGVGTAYMWKTSSHTGMDGNHGHNKTTQRPRIRQIERLATTCLLVPRKFFFTFFRFFGVHALCFLSFFLFTLPAQYCIAPRIVKHSWK